MAPGGEFLRGGATQPASSGGCNAPSAPAPAAAAVRPDGSCWALPAADADFAPAAAAAWVPAFAGYSAPAADAAGGGGTGNYGGGGWAALRGSGRRGRSQVRAPRAGGSAAGGGDGDDGGKGDSGGPDGPSARPRPAEAESGRQGEGGEAPSTSGGEGDEAPPSLGVRAALAALGFYRGVLSPLMPSTCRFLPTCSVYSIESYKKFGVARGSVLTAWRLLRCNPWGGRGYDPPAWPPVGLGAFYNLPYTPEISVVLGLAAAYWLVASTIESLVY